MKPKLNSKGDIYKASPMDLCESPAHAINPLLHFIPTDWLIWEPACGSGRMVRAFERAGYQVLGSDIQQGENFFDITCDGADVLISNPPFSVKYLWIQRCYDIGLPFAMILPVEFIGSQKAQKMMQQYGFGILLLNRRINFHMPQIGWGKDGKQSSAQFPVCWYTWQLLPEQIMFGEINPVEELDEIEVEV